MKKKVIAIILFLCVVALILFNFSWTKKIDITLQGTQFQLGTNEEGFQTEVKLNGTIKKSWFRIKSFQGTIDIEGETTPTEKYEKQITISFDNDGEGHMVYDYWENGTPYLMQYGVLFVDKDMRRLVIIPYYTSDGARTNGWSGEDGRLIVAPAMDRQDGLNIANELMTKFTKYHDLK